MKELLIENKKVLIGIGVVIALFVVLSIVNGISKGLNNHKITEGNDYVYTLRTKKNESGKVSSLPIINLDFKAVEKNNTDIQDLFYQMTKDKRNTVTYEFTVHNKILFLLIRIDFYDVINGTMNTRFLSFNIDLKTGELLQNEAILKKYDYTTEDVKNSIYKEMQTNYKDGHEKGYVDTFNCDFNCYLRNHGFSPNQLEGGVSLFVKNKKLVIYRGFTIDTVLGDKNYFVKEDFIFSLEK